MRLFSDGLTLAGPHAVVEGAPRSGGDRAIDIGLVGRRHIGDHRPGRRVDDLEGLTRNGADHLSVNQHLRRATEKRRRVPQSRIELERVHRFSSHAAWTPALAWGGAPRQYRYI